MSEKSFNSRNVPLGRILTPTRIMHQQRIHTNSVGKFACYREIVD
jgi:hypothetical protein